jgi:hypothetical protein
MSAAVTTRREPTTPRGLLAQVVSLAPLLAVAGFLWFAVDWGLPPRDAALGVLAIGLTQVLPGALCWRAVRPGRGWLLEDLAMGFALGSCLAIAAQVVAGLSRLAWLSAAIPLAVGAVLLAVPPTRRRVLEARWERLPLWFGPVLALASLPAVVQLLGFFARNRLAWPPGAWWPHVDLYLHQALAAELLHRGPVAWPTVRGEELGYHWFAHAWVAQVSSVSGVGLDAMLARLMPAMMPAVVVACAGVAALRLSGRPAVGAVAGVLTMAGGAVNVVGGASLFLPVSAESPTLALGAPTLLALVVVMALRWRGEARRGAYVLVPVLAVAAAGTKGSTAPLVIAGLGMALVAMLVVNRALVWPVALDLVVVTAALVATVAVVFHGSAAGLEIDPVRAAQQTSMGRWLGELPTGSLQAMGLATTVVAALSRGAVAFVLPFRRAERRDPLTWLLLGAGLAAAAAVAIFTHPGSSQGYFVLTAVPLLAIGSALGLALLWEVLGTRAFGAAVVVGAVGGWAAARLPVLAVGGVQRGYFRDAWAMLAIGAGVMLVAAVLGGLLLRSRLTLAGGAAVVVLLSLLSGGMVVLVDSARQPVRVDWGPVPLTSALATTQQQIDAARYIRDHSDVDDLVMTNRHCTTPRSPAGGCDNRRWVVTAFSERQSLVEGWTATPRATELAKGADSVTLPYWKPEVLALNDGFVERPSAAGARELWDLGVRWVYVDHLRPHAQTLEPYAVERFGNDDATVYELLPPR